MAKPGAGPTGADLEQNALFRLFSQAVTARSQARPLISLKKFGRNERIRTSGPFVPNEVRYRAALHPEQFLVHKITENRINTQIYFEYLLIIIASSFPHVNKKFEFTADFFRKSLHFE